MSILPLSRMAASLCVDGSMALIAGCLLSGRWLRGLTPRRASVQRVVSYIRSTAAALLCLALCAHLFLLTAEFSGASSLAECFRQMPSVLSTHAGKLDAAGLALAALLLAVACFRDDVRSRSILMAAVFCGLLLLRSSTGHAAADGPLSLSVVLQAVHLASMAVWSGAILVSGFCVTFLLTGVGGRADPQTRDRIRRNNRAGFTADRDENSAWLAYMSELSLASTWSVGLVFLSGLLKSYRALGGHIYELRSGTWGSVLTAKIACVAISLSLGALNRIWLNRTRSTGVLAPISLRRSLIALRAEAFVMVLILLLSAILGNVDPPDLS